MNNHGANIYELSKNLNVTKSQIKDFSSNVNPLGISKKALNNLKNNIDMISMYPDPNYINLKKAISIYNDCSFDNIILGNGATELISAFIKSFDFKNCTLIYPCYSEYEKELNKQNIHINKYVLNENNDFELDLNNFDNFIKSNDSDLVIICNPNNPTGSFLTDKNIEFLIKNNPKSLFMIDETYIEFSMQKTSGYLTDSYSNIFVIKGSSKFFSAPGIRLGYGIFSNKEGINKIYKHIYPWNINIFAQLLGEIMFLDEEYINSTKLYIQKEKDKLLKFFKSKKELKIYNSSSNFILIKILKEDLNASSLYNILIKDYIAIRNCSSFEPLDDSYFRICVLDKKSNDCLISKLDNIFD
ncbi:MAG: aminotransferase class I/II-fold pyridoxal phosphate-dependent enzyme [Peptostreptococcaceae bacterium]|jgi:threonine-phosphate decarboxylase|nr:aminotransferase class I/II-fold pyridoxal phosphate-dependent enzyme [Peptostreptococcaceae bacterium]